MFIKTKIFVKFEKIEKQNEFDNSFYEVNGAPIYCDVIINTDNICYINCKNRMVYFNAPDGSGMTTYGLHKQIAPDCWEDFCETVFL